MEPHITAEILLNKYSLDEVLEKYPKFKVAFRQLSQSQRHNMTIAWNQTKHPLRPHLHNILQQCISDGIFSSNTTAATRASHQQEPSSHQPPPAPSRPRAYSNPPVIGKPISNGMGGGNKPPTTTKMLIDSKSIAAIPWSSSSAVSQQPTPPLTPHNNVNNSQSNLIAVLPQQPPPQLPPPAEYENMLLTNPIINQQQQHSRRNSVNTMALVPASRAPLPPTPQVLLKHDGITISSPFPANVLELVDVVVTAFPALSPCGHLLFHVHCDDFSEAPHILNRRGITISSNNEETRNTLTWWHSVVTRGMSAKDIVTIVVSPAQPPPPSPSQTSNPPSSQQQQQIRTRTISPTPLPPSLGALRHQDPTMRPPPPLSTITTTTASKPATITFEAPSILQSARAGRPTTSKTTTTAVDNTHTNIHDNNTSSAVELITSPTMVKRYAVIVEFNHERRVFGVPNADKLYTAVEIGWRLGKDTFTINEAGTNREIKPTDNVSQITSAIVFLKQGNVKSLPPPPAPSPPSYTVQVTLNSIVHTITFTTTPNLIEQIEQKHQPQQQQASSLTLWFINPHTNQAEKIVPTTTKPKDIENSACVWIEAVVAVVETTTKQTPPSTPKTAVGVAAASRKTIHVVNWTGNEERVIHVNTAEECFTIVKTCFHSILPNKFVLYSDELDRPLFPSDSLQNVKVLTVMLPLVLYHNGEPYEITPARDVVRLKINIIEALNKNPTNTAAYRNKDDIDVMYIDPIERISRPLEKVVQIPMLAKCPSWWVQSKAQSAATPSSPASRIISVRYGKVTRGIKASTCAEMYAAVSSVFSLLADSFVLYVVTTGAALPTKEEGGQRELIPPHVQSLEVERLLALHYEDQLYYTTAHNKITLFEFVAKNILPNVPFVLVFTHNQATKEIRSDDDVRDARLSTNPVWIVKQQQPQQKEPPPPQQQQQPNVISPTLNSNVSDAAVFSPVQAPVAAPPPPRVAPKVKSPPPQPLVVTVVPPPVPKEYKINVVFRLMSYQVHVTSASALIDEISHVHKINETGMTIIADNTETVVRTSDLRKIGFVQVIPHFNVSFNNTVASIPIVRTLHELNTHLVKAFPTLPIQYVSAWREDEGCPVQIILTEEDLQQFVQWWSVTDVPLDLVCVLLRASDSPFHESEALHHLTNILDLGELQAGKIFPEFGNYLSSLDSDTSGAIRRAWGLYTANRSHLEGYPAYYVFLMGMIYDCYNARMFLTDRSISGSPLRASPVNPLKVLNAESLTPNNQAAAATASKPRQVPPVPVEYSPSSPTNNNRPSATATTPTTNSPSIEMLLQHPLAEVFSQYPKFQTEVRSMGNDFYVLFIKQWSSGKLDPEIHKTVQELINMGVFSKAS